MSSPPEGEEPPADPIKIGELRTPSLITNTRSKTKKAMCRELSQVPSERFWGNGRFQVLLYLNKC